MTDLDETARTLRLALDEAANRHQLSPGSWQEIARRLHRQPLRRAAIAALIVSVVAASSLTAASYLRHKLGSSGAARGRSEQQLTVVSRLHLPGGGWDVAAGAGAVWIGGLGVTYKVDPATGKITATVPTAGTDEFSRMAVGFGAVWITGGNRPGDHLGILRISPADDRVTAFITMPDFGLPGAVAIADGRVWVGSDADGGSILRVDPHTNRVSGRPLRIGMDVGAIVPGAGALWVTHTNAGGSVTAINPSTGAISDLSSSAWHKVTAVETAGAGSLWMAGNNVIQRINPASGRLTASITVRGAAQVISWVTFWHGSVWAITSSGSGSGPASIIRINPATDQVAGRPVVFGDTPAALTAGPTGLWAIDVTNTELVHLALRGTSG